MVVLATPERSATASMVVAMMPRSARRFRVAAIIAVRDRITRGSIRALSVRSCSSADSGVRTAPQGLAGAGVDHVVRWSCTLLEGFTTPHQVNRLAKHRLAPDEQ